MRRDSRKVLAGLAVAVVVFAVLQLIQGKGISGLGIVFAVVILVGLFVGGLAGRVAARRRIERSSGGTAERADSGSRRDEIERRVRERRDR